MTSPETAPEDKTSKPVVPYVPPWIVITTLGVICAFSFGIRLIDLHRGLWLDELHTSWVVSDGLGSVWSRAEAGNQSPLYFWIVWAFVSVGGHTEIVLRLVSVLAGVGLSVVGFQIVATWTRSKVAGLIAAGFIAIDPTFLEYSQEARPYALLQFLAWIQVLFYVARFQQILGATKKESKISGCQIGFILTAVVCFYIHYTSILLTGACFLSILIWKVVSGSRWTMNNLAGLLDFVWIFVFCLPLFGSIWAISERKSNWELFVNDSTYSHVLWFQFLTYVLPAIVLVAVGLSQFSKSERSSKGQFLFLMGSLYFIPIIGTWISLKTGVAALYHPRYFMIGTTGIILLACTAFAYLMEMPKKWSQYLGTSVFVAMAFLSVYQNSFLWSVQDNLQMPFESSWKVAVKSLANEAEESDLIYLFPNLIEDQFLSPSKEEKSNFDADELRQYCLFPVKGIYRVDQCVVHAKSTLATPRFKPDDAEEMMESQTVFLVIRGDQGLISDILSEFASYGPQQGLFIRNVGSQLYEYRGASRHFIAVFKFDITEDSDSP